MFSYEKVEKYRVLKNPKPLSLAMNDGLFLIPGPFGPLKIQASSGEGWEHVSVSPYYRESCPVWEEMCYVKDLFWGEEDRVMQLHPPRSEYSNFHPFVLHLWRPQDVEVPHPPAMMVGPVTHEDFEEFIRLFPNSPAAKILRLAAPKTQVRQVELKTRAAKKKLKKEKNREKL